ncbi:peptidoglycan DD-metalloendopeptidase family protein [Candidatus Parcubacteria bacterium]|nr:peptidoglycan DD-metalloendopeptidase family protein [Candidatus Parcubacteria bacterium]
MTTAFLAAALFISGLPLPAEAAFFPLIPLLFDKPKVVVVPEKPMNVQTMPLLQAAVNVDPNPAKGGGDITIVGSALLAENGPSGTIRDVEEREVNPDHISVYVVREGDTLADIAKLFGVSVNTITWANDLKSRTVKAGDQLIILPVSGVQHTIVKGDTLESVAKKYKGDISEIAQFNELSEDAKLVVGETIMIPDGEVSAPKPASSGVKPKIKGSGPALAGYYTRPVKSGVRSQGLHGYNGVDLAATYGSSVYAAAGGQVIVSRNYGYNGGYGSYVVIKHPNNTQTLYAHLSANLVFQGAYVEKGQVIGAVGNSGKSTGPHLHFEVRGAANPF